MHLYLGAARSSHTTKYAPVGDPSISAPIIEIPSGRKIVHNCFHLQMAPFSVSRFLPDAMSKVAIKPRRLGISDLRKNAMTNDERPDPVAHGV
jgi:hypothetical protein